MAPTPILILSDSPDQPTGLGRITRDLARHLVRMPEFRVGTLGRGGWGSRQLPFVQYNFGEQHQWGEQILPRIWNDFTAGEAGILMTIWDPSRLNWVGMPQYSPKGICRKFLTGPSRPRTWGYFPVDSEGVDGKLSSLSSDTVRGFDRVLAYGIFGSQILGNALGSPPEWIPHGINCDIFCPRDPKAARMALKVSEGVPIVGCVMTNQARKDWGLAFAIFKRLSQMVPGMIFWCHIDVPVRTWSLPALVTDYGLRDQVRVTYEMSDTDLSYYYSACDLTILPSLGEGYGYPIVESLACGTPVFHGKYGGGVELVPEERFLVEPSGYRMETIHNCIRPVFNPEEWVRKIHEYTSGGQRKEDLGMRESVEHLHWTRLWEGAWKKWFLQGVQ